MVGDQNIDKTYIKNLYKRVFSNLPFPYPTLTDRFKSSSGEEWVEMLEKVGKGVFLSLNYRCPKNMGFCWKMAIVTYYLNPSPSCQCMIAHLFSIGDIHYCLRQDRTMLSLKAPITLQWSLLASLGFHSIEINALEAKLCFHMSFLACHVKVLVATGWPWLVIAADIQLASLFFNLNDANCNMKRES